MIKLGEKIKSLRKQKNISQEVLANYLGVSFQAVSKWENDSTMPDVTMIPALASFFGVSTDELFDFNLFEMEKQVEDTILKDFPLPQKVDSKFYSYLRTIVRTKLTQEYHSYSDEASAREFSTAFQGLFESLLKQHRERFPEEYNKMIASFSSCYDNTDNIKLRKNAMRQLFKFLFNKEVPRDIYAAAAGAPDTPKSLRGYLVATILTQMYNEQFYQLILKYHEELNDLCSLRNTRGHVHTDSEKVKELLTQQQVESYYSFLKTFIYEYTTL